MAVTSVVKKKMTDKKSKQNGDKDLQQSVNAFEFVGDVKSELKKITWTSKEEIKVYTKVVVISTFVFGLMIYMIDLFVQGGLSSLSSLVKWVFG